MMEGRTSLPIDADADQRGPASRDPERPFYNPAMRVNRDLSLLLVDAFARSRGRQVDVADVLAGAGARSLRLAHEVEADITVHANDGDPKAVQAMRDARAENGIPEDRLLLREGNAHVVLATRRFDVVDVDPYGSPAPFVDAAVRAARHQGLVCLTATDTASLCGRYPRVCRRRYGAWHGLHARPWRAEVGLRILAGSIVQAAARHEQGATPVLCVASGHWMRVVCRIEDGRGRADASMRSLADAVPDARGGGVFARRPREGPEWAGPLWGGPLHDAAHLRAMRGLAGRHDLDGATTRLLDLLLAEAQASAFWLESGDLRSRIGVDAPRQQAFRARLRDAGFEAAPSHIDAQGTRTDAPWDAVKDAWIDGKAV